MCALTGEGSGATYLLNFVNGLRKPQYLYFF